MVDVVVLQLVGQGLLSEFDQAAHDAYDVSLLLGLDQALADAHQDGVDDLDKVKEGI